MEWDIANDEVTLTFDPEKLSLTSIVELIGKAGFQCARAETTPRSAPEVSRMPWKAPVPEDAPVFFKEAFSRAQASARPIILDFSAAWCAPCTRLKKETLDAPEVKAILADVELILVDLDTHASLARAYGVQSIPDVFFIDRRGWVVDRLKNFENPTAFVTRVRKLLGAKTATF